MKRMSVVLIVVFRSQGSQALKSSVLKKRLGEIVVLVYIVWCPPPSHTRTPHTHTHTHTHTHPHPHSHPYTHTHTLVGFWGDLDSEGSDLDLPAVTPLNEDKEDFDFYG